MRALQDLHIGTIDLKERVFVSPSSALCDFLGVAETGSISIAQWGFEPETIAASLRRGSRREARVTLSKDNLSFTAGIYPLEFMDSENRYMSVFLFNAGADAAIDVDARYLLDSMPVMAAVGAEDTLIYANNAFLSFFNCDCLDCFMVRHMELKNIFISRQGYFHNAGENWLEEAIKMGGKGCCASKVLLYSDKDHKYHIFNMLVQKMGVSGNYLFVFAELAEFDEMGDAADSGARHIQLYAEKQQDMILQLQARLTIYSKMVDMVTHQWKQPLNSIGMLVQGIEEYCSDSGALSKDNLKKNCESILKQVYQMAASIDEFRSFFRPSKSLGKFFVEDVVKGVTSLFIPIIANSNINVSSASAAGIMAYGHAHEVKLVLMNVLMNARDAILQRYRNDPSTADSPKQIGNIGIDVVETEQHVVISVYDDGGGIPEGIITRVFDQYVSTKGDRGAGIGLYLSRAIMTNMNGSIKAENIDKGTVFTITLPRAFA